MDKKSFLRGFGAGVLFASVILGISFSMRTSKGQVISQARKYGMVFQNKEEKLFSSAKPDSSSDENVSPNPSAGTQTNSSTDKNGKDDSSDINPSIVPTIKPQNNNATATPKATKKADSSKSNKSDSKKSADDRKKEMEKEKERMKESIENEKKKLTISAGEWSDSVSRKLLNMGVIKSAKDFDSFLNRYGYSSRIVAGTYDVSVNDSYEVLARKITGGR